MLFVDMWLCSAGVWKQWSTSGHRCRQSLRRHVHSWCRDNGRCLWGTILFTLLW